MFEPQKMVGSVSRVLASWRGFWGAHCVCLQEQSKAETDGGLRDESEFPPTSKQKIHSNL